MSSMFSHVLPHGFPLHAIFCRECRSCRHSVNGVSSIPLITDFDLCF